MLERGAALPTSADTEGGECPSVRRRGREGTASPPVSWEEAPSIQDGARASTRAVATLCCFGYR